MKEPAAEVFFMPAAQGQRLCSYRAAAGGAPRGLIVHVHPFAEELNKTRRMAALQARALSQAGYAVLQIDLFGCGDSSGEFEDACWQDWVDDVLLASRWIQQRAQAPLWFWGMRAGCLVAADAARQAHVPCNFLFWQPMPSGKLALQQFLRLKLAAEMLDGGAKGAMDSLRQQLAAGQSVEVAGYSVGAALAQGLEAAQLTPPGQPGRLEWLELSTRADATPSPASAKVLDAWQAAGHASHHKIVVGPSFWQTTEIEEAPSLLDATLAALAASPAP